MKKIAILVLLLILTSFTASAQQKDAGRTIKVELSETVELMGILSRTAGLREYNMTWQGNIPKTLRPGSLPIRGTLSLPIIRGCTIITASATMQ